ncbi:X-Pro dipeptidyl-peptidase-domain-containing protein [Dactylonectria macrodidyma]|uniref:X-Pro dipeptidyl-peptidase-domain-containing protein n=1 Tax=Dactylonectria macrodidyma TaxID=307937 RepID=A0A9P9JNS0_9HYPO|nr:X-Pro dipeptidyl-peptidase-domain-containing protein [Dactylonectria macrodidyma]
MNTKRGFQAAMLDRLMAHHFKLPAEVQTYTIDRTAQIPLRDEVKLLADVYHPSCANKSTPAGTLLVYGPYGRGLMTAYLARCLAPRGYQVLVVCCRGTFGSGGEFDAQRSEVVDGQDIVSWMRRQSWYTGSFATIGASYLGYTQWALLVDPPEDMSTAVILVGPHDFGDFHWSTGAFNGQVIHWADIIAHQESSGLLGQTLRPLSSNRHLRIALNRLPLADAVDEYFASECSWLRQRLANSDLKDPFWAPTKHGIALERATIPILLITGWYDIFIEQTMEQYRRLAERGCPVGLTVGPWTHDGVVVGPTMEEALNWLDEHLVKRGRGHRPNPVRVFITGTREWREIPEWPPATDPCDMYLLPQGGISRNPPTDFSESTFTFNPADPTPDIGSAPLSGLKGDVDDSRLAARSDVLAYTSQPFENYTEILGRPQIEVAHTSDNPHVDLFVRVSEVDAKGHSHKVTEAYIRLDPEREAGPVRLDLHDCAHCFREGTSLRVLIAGGSHPHYLRNLGTGEDPSTGTTLRPSQHTVHHGPVNASRLVLPIARESAARLRTPTAVPIMDFVYAYSFNASPSHE